MVAVRQELPGIPAPTSGLEQLRGQRGQTLQAEQQRLRRVTQEFEAFFTHYLLKTMRETVPEGGLTKDGLLSGDNGKEIYTDLFDMEIARKLARSSRGSLSDILYRSMEPSVRAEYEKTDNKDNNKVELKPLRPQQQLKEIKPAPLPVMRDPGRFRTLQKEPSSLPLKTASSSVAADTITERYGHIITNAAQRNGLDPALVRAVIEAESNGDPRAVSASGAKGLMQLVDSTAAAYGVSNSFDPRQNIAAGARYLSDLIGRFGDLRLALAAYNAGPGVVDQYDGIPPYDETRRYVEKVVGLWSQTGKTPTKGTVGRFR